MNDSGIIIPFVGNDAFRAVLDPVFGVTVIAAAGLSQTVERTVTEQTVKLFFRETCVAGKVFTVRMLKKCIVPGLFFCQGIASLEIVNLL